MSRAWHRSVARSMALLFACVVQAGCSSLPTPSEMVGKALEATGLKAPEPPKLADTEVPKFDVSQVPRYVSFKLHASPALNIDSQGRSLSLVARVYKLKSPDAFWNAPYAAFGNAAKEKELLGDDIVEVRDIQLVPGQQINLREKMSRDVGYVGIVALFHSPAPQRWRYVFAASKLEFSGLAMGAHACSLSVMTGEPLYLDPALARLGPGVCV
jgi:type VI secretion system protein VasD